MITTDREDAVDSLQHIIKKIDRDERSSPTLSRSPRSPKSPWNKKLTLKNCLYLNC